MPDLNRRALLRGAVATTGIALVPATAVSMAEPVDYQLAGVLAIMLANADLSNNEMEHLVVYLADRTLPEVVARRPDILHAVEDIRARLS